MAYPEGDFSFIREKDMCDVLSSMYGAVTETENWDNLKEAEPGDGGFMFSSDPKLRRIVQEICAADNYTGHSGETFAWTLGMMELIAKNGWAAFCAGYIEELQSKIAKLREEFDNALLVYRLILEEAERQTTPEEIERFKEIVKKETIIFDKALYALANAEKELEMLG
mgnify:CR=1 FL=1|jgi:hypothetical protein|uniref:Uncharacterized protein n=1 Tax=viral metagenome TaxID=1070528 RepID=A0A6C0B2W0_9ZZZZ